MKADLESWLKFLGQNNGISDMLGQFWTSNEVIDLSSISVFKDIKDSVFILREMGSCSVTQ